MERIKRLFRGKEKQKSNVPDAKKRVKEISWRDDGSKIFIKVKVVDATPTSWVKRFEDEGNRVASYALDILRHEDVKFHTSHVEYEFVLVKGILFSSKDRTCEHIAEYGKKQGYTALSLYESCLLAEAIDPLMLASLKLEWVMMMTGTIIAEDGKEKLPILNLNKNIKIGKNKIVYTLYTFRQERIQNTFGLYAFVADSKHGFK